MHKHEFDPTNYEITNENARMWRMKLKLEMLKERGWQSDVSGKRILRINVDFSEYVVKFEDVFMTKEYKDLYEAFAEVAKAFKINATKEQLDQLRL